MNNSTNSTRKWIAFLPIILAIILALIFNEICRYRDYEIIAYIPDSGKENLIKSQAFDDSKVKPDAVILGSSLTALLEPFFQSNILGLGLHYLGSSTGLLLLEKKETLPKTIGIEINRIHLKPSLALVEEVTSPKSRTIRKLLPILASYNDPLLIIGNYHRNTNWIQDLITSDKFNPIDRNDRIVHSWDVNHMSSFKDSIELVNRLNEITPVLQSLQKKNIVIFFYEAPCSDLVRSSYYHRAYIKVIDSFTKENNIPFLRTPKNFHFFTADGEHLQPKEAMLFAKSMEKQILLLENSKISSK
jgi:hypothetical protein